MGIVRTIKGFSNAYVDSDQNPLCLKHWPLNDRHYHLTTEQSNGINQNKTVNSQEVWHQDGLTPFTYNFNYNYVDVNKGLMLINMARCAIFIPFEDDMHNWYEEELKYDKDMMELK